MLETINDLVILHREQGHYTKVEPILIETVEGRRLKLGDTHPHMGVIEQPNRFLQSVGQAGKGQTVASKSAAEGRQGVSIEE